MKYFKKITVLSLSSVLLPLAAQAKPTPPKDPVVPEGKIIVLQDQIDYRSEGLNNKRVFVFNGQMMVLFAMKAGQSMPEHSTEEPAYLEVLHGEILVVTGDKVQKIRAGEAILLPAHHPHKVDATADSKFILIRTVPKPGNQK